jgi:hypothetical protein
VAQGARSDEEKEGDRVTHADFLAGAEAMRTRILAGIRRWWDAPRCSRYRPSHPHWLEVAIARIDARELLRSPATRLAGGADDLGRDPKGLGECVDGGPARVGHVPGTELPQAGNAHPGALGDLGEGPSFRVAADLHERQEGGGVGHSSAPVAESGQEINLKPLALVTESSYKVATKNSPARCEFSQDAAASGASPQPERTMSLATHYVSPGRTEESCRPTSGNGLDHPHHRMLDVDGDREPVWLCEDGCASGTAIEQGGELGRSSHQLRDLGRPIGGGHGDRPPVPESMVREPSAPGSGNQSREQHSRNVASTSLREWTPVQRGEHKDQHEEGREKPEGLQGVRQGGVSPSPKPDAASIGLTFAEPATCLHCPHPAATILPVDVSANDHEGTVDGVTVLVSIGYEPSDRSVGVQGGHYAEVDTASATITDRSHWDATHPGVEPTAANILALVKAAADEIEQCAVDHVAANPPEPDFDDDDGSDWEGY